MQQLVTPGEAAHLAGHMKIANLIARSTQNDYFLDWKVNINAASLI
jgi:transketolase